MQTTDSDKIVFACVLAVLVLIASGWVFAEVVERHEQRVLQTRYSQPTPELAAALAAGEADDADEAGDRRLARGR